MATSTATVCAEDIVGAGVNDGVGFGNGEEDGEGLTSVVWGAVDGVVVEGKVEECSVFPAVVADVDAA